MIIFDMTNAKTYNTKTKTLMKKLLYLAIILLGVGFLSSCQKSGPNNDIIGRWKIVSLYSPELASFVDVSGTFTFTANTLTIEGSDGIHSYSETMTYVRDNNKIVLNGGDRYGLTILNLTPTTMELRSDDLFEYKLQRI